MPINTKNIKINQEFKGALNLMEGTDYNLFITGKAGCGKSTLLQLFRETTKKNTVVLAPTGVAAVNISGQTIHSFFKFRIDITLDKIQKIKSHQARDLYSKLDAIIIDEISMVRADLLDCVDKHLRINCNADLPFGGKQMFFFGDLFQLPPVITEEEKLFINNQYQTGYFFSSMVFSKCDLKLIKLHKIYRQKDPEFISLLNSIRINSIADDDLKKLNERYQPEFIPHDSDFYVYLTTRNYQAQAINNDRLNKIDSHEYLSHSYIEGEFYQNSFPADEILKMKVGAQVMFLTNDKEERWINGTMGEIIRIHPEREMVKVLILQEDEEVEVYQNRWDLIKYYYDIKIQKIQSQITGSFYQFPLKLAWAVTIHKSQGKTFEKIILDIGPGTFSPGQLYVALSRCTTLAGIVLKKKIQNKDIFFDREVLRFLNSATVTGHFKEGF